MFFKNKKLKKMEEVTNQSEEEILKNRLKLLMSPTFLASAETIKKIKKIQNQLKALKIEEEYHKWFNNNKPIIEDLFQVMKMHFLEIGEIYELAYEDNNHLKFKNYTLYRDYLIMLLKRYGYKVQENRTCDGTKIKIEISYGKEN